MYEAIFTALCEDAFQHDNLEVVAITQEKLDNLKNNTSIYNHNIISNHK